MYRYYFYIKKYGIIHLFKEVFFRYFKKLYYKLILKKLGNKSFVFGSIIFNNPNKIEIGNNTRIDSLFQKSIIGGGGRIEIGNRCYINFGCVFSPGSETSIIIHDDTKIGFRTTILTTNDHASDYNIEEKKGNVIIGKNVWIGCNTTILPGVTIGNNSIIGAGSIVTKSIPSNVIYGGNPAKFIKNIKKGS